MLFNSLVFILLFLPITLGGYWLLNRWRLFDCAKLFLVFASLFFYAYWEISFLPLIVISIVVNYFIGTWLAHHLDRLYLLRRVFLFVGVTLNLLALGWFKYIDFLIYNYNVLFAGNLAAMDIALPLAISFFTFQQIAYLVDSFYGKTRQYNFFTYVLFVSFFPQLIAGPIVSHDELIPQFEDKSKRTPNWRNIYWGTIIFLMGLAKKTVVADTFAVYATSGFDVVQSLDFVSAWFSSLSYTVQIYFDFSGYCDMALGVALMFNILLPINFDSPYKALDIQDFWRRWHITLSRFLRNYIYIPLGGNRRGQRRACVNIFVVFLLGGLWHGAAWTFVVWGALHGIANVVVRVWHWMGGRFGRFWAWFITFNFINVTWVFFRATSFQSANKVLSGMVDFRSIENVNVEQSLELLGADWAALLGLIGVLVFCVVAPNSLEISRKFLDYTKRFAKYIPVMLALATFLLLMKMIVLPYSEFIYFNF